MDSNNQQALDVLREYSGKEFGWDGRTDCCAFAGDLLKALHGRDFMEDFCYSNKAEAFEVMREHGGLVEAVSSVLGKPKKLNTEELQNGDVLAGLNSDDEWTVGVYFHGRMMVKTKTSIMDWPPTHAQYMWRPCNG